MLVSVEFSFGNEGWPGKGFPHPAWCSGSRGTEPAGTVLGVRGPCARRTRRPEAKPSVLCEHKESVLESGYFLRRLSTNSLASPWGGRWGEGVWASLTLRGAHNLPPPPTASPALAGFQNFGSLSLKQSYGCVLILSKKMFYCFSGIGGWAETKCTFWPTVSNGGLFRKSQVIQIYCGKNEKNS